MISHSLHKRGFHNERRGYTWCVCILAEPYYNHILGSHREMNYVPLPSIGEEREDIYSIMTANKHVSLQQCMAVTHGLHEFYFLRHCPNRVLKCCVDHTRELFMLSAATVLFESTREYLRICSLVSCGVNIGNFPRQ